MADPGFPVGGGVDPLGEGVDLRRGRFSPKMYAKTKELGAVGGACAGHAPLDPPMLMVTISDSGCESLRLPLRCCQYDIVQYDVTVATLPHIAAVLYGTV